MVLSHLSYLMVKLHQPHSGRFSDRNCGLASAVWV